MGIIIFDITNFLRKFQWIIGTDPFAFDRRFVFGGRLFMRVVHLRSKYGRTTPTEVWRISSVYPLICVGAIQESPVSQSPTATNRLSKMLQRMVRTVEDACPYKNLGIRRRKSPNRGRGGACSSRKKPRPPKSIGLSKMLQRMVRVVEAPTPTDVKGKTEEILLTIVGEDIILPQNNRQPTPKRSVDDNCSIHQPVGAIIKRRDLPSGSLAIFLLFDVYLTKR